MDPFNKSVLVAVTASARASLLALLVLCVGLPIPAASGTLLSTAPERPDQPEATRRSSRSLRRAPAARPSVSTSTAASERAGTGAMLVTVTDQLSTPPSVLAASPDETPLIVTYPNVSGAPVVSKSGWTPSTGPRAGSRKRKSEACSDSNSKESQVLEGSLAKRT